LGSLELDPLALGPVQVLLHAPPIALLLSVPEDLAAVERAEQDLTHGRRRPAAGAPRRRDAVLVQRLGDPGEALALCAEGAEAPARGGLLLVYTTNHVEPPAGGRAAVDVVVAVDAAAGDMEGARLALERVIGPLARALALELVGVGGDAQEQLVGRRVDRALAVLEVQEHAHAGLGELLERIGNL